MLLLLFLPSILAVCPSCQQQCPCANQTPKQQTQPCMGFDTRYMATSIDEAMFTFPNLVTQQGSLFHEAVPTSSCGSSRGSRSHSNCRMGQPLFDKSNEKEAAAAAFGGSSAGSASVPVGAAIASAQAKTQSGPAPYSTASVSQEIPAKSVNRFTSPATESQCISQECKACKLSIIDGFLDSAAEKESDSLWGAKVRLQQETGLTSGSCGAENTPPPTTTKKPEETRKQHNKRQKEVLSFLAAFGRKKRAIPMFPSPISNATQPSTNDTQSIMDNLLGVTTNIGCDYRRGSALSTNSMFSGLCNLCWQWRRLPDQFYPNYVNEVACDQSDCGCLSGFGQCMPITRVLNVLQNVGNKTNPNWIQATIDTIATCECQVSMSSPLLSFVSK